ncbi:hypothetical protein ACOMCU_22565 [Lysinibacillus sp. UGB7]|uniref:hypothetical protein n=1 Tax=Lysinibacillus sp. UGB7 TaxID=3411039 RepID=UPI003B76280C
MLDKLWNEFAESEERSTYAEIIAWAYFNPPGVQIKDIQEQFDTWTLEDFETVYDLVIELPPLEGEKWAEKRFGVTDFVSKIDYYEGGNLQILPEFLWFYMSKPRKKQKFF